MLLRSVKIDSLCHVLLIFSLVTLFLCSLSLDVCLLYGLGHATSLKLVDAPVMNVPVLSAIVSLAGEP